MTAPVSNPAQEVECDSGSGHAIGPVESGRNVDLLRGLSNPEEPLRVVSQLLTGITVGERRQRVIRQVQHRLDLTEIDQLVQSYREGAGVKELATMFGISRQTVSDHLDRAAVERRRRGLTEKEILKAAVLYGEGWSLKRLGDRFGIDAETVRQALLKGGVQMRPRNGWAKSRQQI